MRIATLFGVASLVLLGIPSLGTAGNPVYCAERLQAQGIDNQFEIQKRCAVCFSDSSAAICQPPDRSSSGSRSSRSSSNSSSSLGGGMRESSDVGQSFPDVERCLIKERRGEGVWYRNQCRQQDIQVTDVCANEGLEPLNPPDTLLLSGGSSDIKFCKRSR